jgi:hypothetical protein
MKTLIFIAVGIFVSFKTFSQVYKFDVREYNLYIVKGFSEKENILKNSKEFTTEKCDRKYMVDLKKNLVYYYEGGSLKEKLVISGFEQNGKNIEVFVESSLEDNESIQTIFSIYLTTKNKKVKKVYFFWYNPFDDYTMVKDVK